MKSYERVDQQATPEEDAQQKAFEKSVATETEYIRAMAKTGNPTKFGLLQLGYNLAKIQSAQLASRQYPRPITKIVNLTMDIRKWGIKLVRALTTIRSGPEE